MAMAHRKCDECHFWFQSAKTYHQHRSQLPNQLPGENKVKNPQLTTEFFFQNILNQQLNFHLKYFE